MAEQTLRERACRFVDCPAEKSSAAKFHDPECNELLAEFTAAVGAIKHDVIQAAFRPEPMCRDCADENGRCPNNDMRLCDPYEAVLEQLRSEASAVAQYKARKRGALQP